MIRVCSGHLAVWALFLICMARLTANGQVRVTTSGGGDPSLNDGSSWERALSAAQLAQRLGPETTGGSLGEYWLAMGAYSDLWLHRGVKIYGGFKGNEQSRGERDPALNQTTLMGVSLKTYTVRTVQGEFVEQQNPDEGVLVDGCVFVPTDTAPGLALSFSSGVNYGGPPVINNCRLTGSAGFTAVVIVGNGPLKMVDSKVESGKGPGISVGNTEGLLDLTHCEVIDNQGAGIYAITGSKIVLNRCVVARNGRSLYSGFGGETSGIHLEDASAEVRDTEIRENQAWSGGGLYVFLPSVSAERVLVRDSTLLQNKAFQTNNTGGGGGVFISSYQPNTPDRVTLTNCQIMANVSAGRGGGAYVRGSGARFLASDIRDNRATGEGGGAFFGIAPSIMESGLNRVSVQACIIAGNRSQLDGGGLAAEDTDPLVAHCTFAKNTAERNGGAIHTVFGRLQDAFGSPQVWKPAELINSALTENQAAQGTVLYHSVGMYSGPATNAPPPPRLSHNAYDLIGTLKRYSQYEPLSDIAVTTDNLRISNPGYVDANAGDYRLLAGSPLIDRGTNVAGMELLGTDRDGSLRQQGAAADIGAYEWKASGAVPNITIHWEPGGLRLDFVGRLQTTESLLAPNWREAAGITNGTVIEPSGGQRFWRTAE